MKPKDLFSFLFVSCFLFLVVFPVFSTEIEVGISPYVGADIQFRRMDFRTGYGDNFVPRNHPQANIYGGLMFSEFVGLEGGYESTSTKTIQESLTTGDSAGGAPVQRSVSPVVFRGTSRIKGPHLNLIGFSQVSDSDNFRLFGSIGIAVVKANVERKIVSMGNSQMGMYRTFSKRKSLLRLSAGVQYLINDSWSSRLTAGWVNTGNMKLSPNDSVFPAHLMIKPKDTITFGAGIQYNF